MDHETQRPGYDIRKADDLFEDRLGKYEFQLFCNSPISNSSSGISCGLTECCIR
jgi:hypothetical protein